MIAEEIKRLKEERNAVILAHYYVDGQVQKLADYVGDSFYLAKVASKTDKQTIVFCGVRFMGESAKLLNPDRCVLLPDESADCPMAHMATEEQISRLRAQTEDLAVVCYINSSAKLKSLSDVCVTSSNAIKIVGALPNKNILFIPDANLGGYVQKHFPEKTFYFSDGYCPVHAVLLPQDILTEKETHPQAKFLVHPEARKEVCELADFIGSTSEIIEYAQKSGADSFILGTEPGVLYELKNRCPEKTFYPVTPVCEDMKRITPEKLLACLRDKKYEVRLDNALCERARLPLERMLELAR